MATYKEAMAAASNDYSQLERAFERDMGQELVRVQLDATQAAAVRTSLSVIIPTYNGHKTLATTLARMATQSYRNFEVIVVDDGSNHALPTAIREHCGLTGKWVRLGTNRGPEVARNVGLSCADGTVAVFLDDDIGIEKDALLGVAIRHQLVAGCLVVGFREHVDERRFHDPSGSPAHLEGDWRCCTYSSPDHALLTARRDVPMPESRVGPYRLLEESDKFKAFGHGAVIGLWDLPQMVIGHSMSARRDEIIAAGGFVERRFRGWGVDDLMFGAFMVAAGIIVVPALEWVSLHPRHEGRKVTRAEEWRELLRNLEAYRAVLDERSGSIKFPRHRLRGRGVREAMQLLEAE